VQGVATCVYAYANPGCSGQSERWNELEDTVDEARGIRTVKPSEDVPSTPKRAARHQDIWSSCLQSGGDGRVMLCVMKS
jgi:hypothetical protein